ncbi:hypothetical protein JCM10212_002241 [Sporobolomyces blumeae]
MSSTDPQLAYSRATSTDPGSIGLTTTGGDVGTPIGSDANDDDDPDSGAATPSFHTEDDGAPSQLSKNKSKALNFLKKKETKNVKGTTYKIDGDEIVLEADPRGEAKIDENGNLLGGRAWKVHTFTSPMRANPDKLYMLSIDAARCAGFRDSLYFFRRNPLIHKLACAQPEKDRLIELGKLNSNLKSRAVTIVSARNVFKVMGATFVQNGKYILDDYYEDKSLAAGHQPGEPAFIEPYDPDKDTGTLAVSKGNAPPGATSLGLNVLIGHPGKPKMPGSELISSQIGGGLHATFGGTGLQPFGKSWDPSAKKAKPASHLDVETWMHEYAKEIGETNRRLLDLRRGHVGQVAVSLGIEERDEDCWETVEEEYTDDEAQPQSLPAAYQPTHLHPTGPPPSNQAVPPPPASSSSSAPSDPNAPAAASASTFSLPTIHGPENGSSSPHPSTSQAVSPLPFAAAAASAITSASAVVRPKKKRLTRRFNPIRGYYEPETNVPHVYRSTQPTFVVDVYRDDAAAHVYPRSGAGAGGVEGGGGGRSGTNGNANANGKERRVPDDGDEDDSKADALFDVDLRRKQELAAAKVGTASVELVSWDRAWNSEETVAREPLLPGMWDFGAGPDAVEAMVDVVVDE